MTKCKNPGHPGCYVQACGVHGSMLRHVMVGFVGVLGTFAAVALLAAVCGF